MTADSGKDFIGIMLTHMLVSVYKRQIKVSIFESLNLSFSSPSND